MTYRNTQLGTAMILISGAVFALLAYVAYSEPEQTIWPAFLIIGVVAMLFFSLTIEVDNTHIKWFFGPGFWRKSIALKEIESARVIKVKWYFGLGIRLVSTGWLYNVSGLTAVELKLKDDTIVSLGSNEPYKLVQAIEINS